MGLLILQSMMSKTSQVLYASKTLTCLEVFGILINSKVIVYFT